MKTYRRFFQSCKSVTFSLVLFLVLALSACSLFEKKTEASFIDPSSEPPVLYAAVLDKYYQALSEEWETQTMLDASLNYLISTGFGQTDLLDNYGYAFIDLDGDHIDELLIGRLSTEKQPHLMIYDMYTFTNGAPVQVFMSTEKDQYFLCSDRTIYNSRPNSFSLSIHYLYQLKETKLAFKEGVISTNFNFYHTFDTDLDTSNDIPLDHEEADQLINQYASSRVVVKYTPFAEYK